MKEPISSEFGFHKDERSLGQEMSLLMRIRSMIQGFHSQRKRKISQKSGHGWTSFPSLPEIEKHRRKWKWKRKRKWSIRVRTWNRTSWKFSGGHTGSWERGGNRRILRHSRITTWEEEIPLQAEEMPVTTVERQPRFEIRGDVSTDNIIEGTRVRRRREAYITQLGQPDEYIGYRSTFTAAIQLGKQQRFHRNDLPPPPENWKKITHSPSLWWFFGSC